MINTITKAKKVLFLVLLFSLSIFSDSFAQDAKNGKAVFRSKCASCHDLSLQKDMTGPALQGVVDRWAAAGEFKGKSGEEWLKAWILNFNNPVSAGYPYANKIVNYASSNMNVFEGQISDKDYGDILAYLKDPGAANAGQKVAAAAGTAEASKPKSGGSSILLFSILCILIVIAFYLGLATDNISDLIAAKKGEPIPQRVPFYLSKKFKTSLVIFATLFFFYALCKNAIQLGRSQGYQPVQPIKYSHALHAGKNKIDCQYCHSSADKGKHSNIPSLNVCMNCHKNVQEGPVYGKTEIAKIYKALDYNPQTGEYGNNPQPIQWVRIHNLPDHVYFNHAQHVNAGKVQCQTCHGPIEEMEEVYQYSPLSMGWCVNCHRNYDVAFNDNSYYQTYVKYHEELKSGKRKRVTVNDIGGTECQKCHY